jgi:quercetin dioxygenase-like cupin family protein
MQKKNLETFVRGWVVGSFDNTLFHRENVEVAIKKYKAGDKETAHYHSLTTEYTIIVSGKVKMNDIEYNENDIVVIYPKEKTSFEAIEDTITVVIRDGSFPNDKT